MKKLSREDLFAEHLANGKSIPHIQEIMGLTKGAARGIMYRICQKLGAQAV